MVFSVGWKTTVISALTTFALDNLACCLVWEMSSMNMALLFTIIFMSKLFCMHNIMSTTGVWGVQATMLSLTSPQKNAFKRPEQNVRIFFLPIFIACLEQHIYYVLRKSEIAQFEWAYKAGWFHHFFLPGSQHSF